MNMASGKGNSLKDKKKNLKTPTHLLILHLCPYSVLPTIYHVIKVSYFLKVPWNSHEIQNNQIFQISCLSWQHWL